MPVPDDRKKKPQTTAEAKIPGAFEGETVTRRRFMTGTAHTAGGVAAAAFTLPALGMAFGPVFESSPEHWEAGVAAIAHGASAQAETAKTLARAEDPGAATALREAAQATRERS